MCNDFGNRVPYSDYLAARSQTRIPIKSPNASPNLGPSGRPTEPRSSVDSKTAHTSSPVPASFFSELTDSKSAKPRWKFTKVGEPRFRFADLWRLMPDGGAAFTLLTTIRAPMSHRSMVVLERSDWSAWLQETSNEGDLLRAVSLGSLKVEQIR